MWYKAEGLTPCINIERKKIMANIKIKTKRGGYRKEGSIMFVYGLEGSAKDLETYKKDKGDYYKEDPETKEPLFWSREQLEIGASVNRTTNGNWVCGDLESEASAQKDATNLFIGKISAAAAVLGISKRDAAKMMFAS